MAEFAKYSFNRAHAYGYAVLAYWTAWLKVHYPIEFFTSVMSTVKADRIPEFVTEARRMGFAILPPDINESGKDFTAMPLGVRYGLEAIKSVGEKAVAKILDTRPYTSFEDFRARSGVDSGVTATLARIGAFDSLVANRHGLETLLAREKSGVADQCIFKIDPMEMPNAIGVLHGLPCAFDWDREPVPINKRTGKELKRKPIPKRCTKACRNYTAPPPFDLESVGPYTEEDIRNIEMEVLGIHLSSTPFDALPADDREVCAAEADRIEDGPEGSYMIAGTLSKARKHTDRNGKDMGFLGVVTERNELDVVVFNKQWEKYKPYLKVGTLLYLEVIKNERGISLAFATPAQ